MPIFRVPVNVTWTGSGSPGVNVFHVRTVSEVFNQLELDSAVDAIHQFYTTAAFTRSAGGALFANGTSWTLGEVVDVDTQEYRTADWTTLTAASSAKDLPPSVQMVVGWRTSVAARRGRGRTFLGPLSEFASEADGTPSADCLADLRLAANNLVNASLAGNGWSLGVYGYRDAFDTSSGNTRPANDPRVLRDVTQASVKDRFAVLRSRRD